jgi:hypothetical protein
MVRFMHFIQILKQKQSKIALKLQKNPYYGNREHTQDFNPMKGRLPSLADSLGLTSLPHTKAHNNDCSMTMERVIEVEHLDRRYGKRFNSSGLDRIEFASAGWRFLIQ